MQAGIQHHVAARDRVFGNLFAGQIQRATLARHALRRGPILRVQRTHPRSLARRADEHAIADRNHARQNRAGDDGAGTRQREAAIDRQAKPVVRRTQRRLGRFAQQTRAQLAEPLARARRHGKNVGAGQRGRCERVADFGFDVAPPRLVDEIDFAQHDQAATYAQQIDDRQMLARLRHDAVVGGDDQQQKIDAARAGQHRMHEPFVARHVDEADHFAVCGRQIGEAELDRDAACFLFFETVGVDAGQCLYQRGLAVIDMTGGTDDHTRLFRSSLRRSDLRFGQGAAHRRQKRMRQRAARALCPQQPAQRGFRIALDARAEMIGGAQHRLPVRLAAHRRFAPPMGCFCGIARNAQRVVIEHAEPRHRRGDALRSREFRPAPRLDRI